MVLHLYWDGLDGLVVGNGTEEDAVSKCAAVFEGGGFKAGQVQEAEWRCAGCYFGYGLEDFKTETSDKNWSGEFECVQEVFMMVLR